MQKLTNNEKLIALGGLAFISASITFIDWWMRGRIGSADALLAGIIGIVTLFWLPVSLGYYLMGKFGGQRVVRELPIWFICFYFGYRVWAVALVQLYPTFQFGWVDSIFMCLPWAIGTYIIYRSYGAYKALQAERLLRKQAELNHLKQTLHPHFLFNSLNTLSAFIVSDPMKAEQLTQDLASVLRQILDTDKSETISLKHELLVLQKWLNIEEARLGSDLKVDFDIDEDALSFQLPPFVLQPLLENAIKHAQKLPILIDLSCQVRDGKLSIYVRDTGPGFPEQVLTNQGLGDDMCGVGLRTTLQRIKLSPNASYTLTNGQDSFGAVVCIELESQHG